MIIQNFKKLKKLLTPKHIKYLFAVFFGNQIGGILEMIGLGIIPVLAIYMFNKEKLFILLEEKNLNILIEFFNSQNSFIISLSILVFFSIKKYLLSNDGLLTKKSWNDNKKL